jgi:hypothetical protein
MNFKAVSPQDIIADDATYAGYNGQQIRKGTFAALLANIEIIEQATTTAEKEPALAMIKTLVPQIILAGAHKHLIWKNPEVQQIMAAAAATSVAENQ